MDTKNIYQDTLIQIKETFHEEAASFLSEEQVEQILQTEEAQMHFAQQNQIPVSSWIGSNTRRYCKDLLRRQQPFFVLYYLLSVCTEASIVLFICYLIHAVIDSYFAPVSFAGVPGVILVLFWYKEWNKSHTRRSIRKSMVPKKGHRIIFLILPAITVSLCFLLLWQQIAPLLQQLTFKNTFLLYVALLFLSGIHNILYSSHLITFFSVGAFRVSKRGAEEQQRMMDRYLRERSTSLLALQKKTVLDMDTNPSLHADIAIKIRSHLITTRIYLTLALFLLIVLDILCIYQYLQLHTLSILLFTIIVCLITGLLLICFLSCNLLIQQISK